MLARISDCHWAMLGSQMLKDDDDDEDHGVAKYFPYAGQREIVDSSKELVPKKRKQYLA